MAKKILIISDNNECITKLTEYINEFSARTNTDLELINNRFDESQSYMLIIIDIAADARKGMNVARQIRSGNNTVSIALFAADTQYAIEGYSVNAAAYWLTSIEFDYFVKDFNRILLKNRRCFK